MSQAVIPSVRLNTETAIPTLGLGVYQIPKGKETQQAVSWAFQVGYRHIDTASLYKNEADVGRAIAQSGIPRRELFVTTKLWVTDFLFAERAFEKSRTLLGLDYIDLYLIHWPAPLGKRQAWSALEKIHASGRAKAIGVSNYSMKDLEALAKYAKVVPAVNQVEFSPFLYRKELLEYCQAKGIQLEAYSPLTRGKRLDDGRIVEIATRYGKSPAQIMIRWSLQHGLAVIPKSSNQQRIIENGQVFDFELSREDMERMDGLHDNYRALFK